MRVCCLAVPSFPLAAKLRAQPELAGRPLAVFEGEGAKAKLLAATPLARRAGISTGLSAPQARARLPHLAVVARDLCCERSAQQALLELCEGASPAVEDAAPGVLYLEVSHWKDATAEGRRLLFLAEKLGLPARLGVAGTRLAARLAALSPESPCVIAPGQDAAFLAPQSAARLPVPADLKLTLERWGIKTIGQAAALPSGGLIRRLGKDGERLLALARGDDRRPLLARPRPAALIEEEKIDWAVDELEAFLDWSRRLLERLCARLESSGQSCRRLDVELSLDYAGRESRRLELAAPARDVGTLLGLLRLSFSEKPPAAAVTGLSLSAEPDRPRLIQLSLFGPASLSPDRLSSLLARLSAWLGPARVGSPKEVDGHAPEKWAMSSFAPPDAPDFKPDVMLAPAPAATAVRALRPAIALEVIEQNGVPCAVRSRELSGKVRVASGPWLMEEGWWDKGVSRRYWDVELSDEGLYRIYQDKDGWHADGIYD